MLTPGPHASPPPLESSGYSRNRWWNVQSKQNLVEGQPKFLMRRVSQPSSPLFRPLWGHQCFIPSNLLILVHVLSPSCLLFDLNFITSCQCVLMLQNRLVSRAIQTAAADLFFSNDKWHQGHLCTYRITSYNHLKKIRQIVNVLFNLTYTNFLRGIFVHQGSFPLHGSWLNEKHLMGFSLFSLLYSNLKIVKDNLAEGALCQILTFFSSCNSKVFRFVYIRVPKEKVLNLFLKFSKSSLCSSATIYDFLHSFMYVFMNFSGHWCLKLPKLEVSSWTLPSITDVWSHRRFG